MQGFLAWLLSHKDVIKNKVLYLRRHYPFRPVRARPLVIDCGANIGVATLYFKTVAPEARVIAFEPEPTAYELLRENVERNRLTDVACTGGACGRDQLGVMRISLAQLRLGHCQRFDHSTFGFRPPCLPIAPAADR